MEQESYAATVARHLAAIEDTLLTLVKTEDPSTRAACVKVITTAMECINAKTRARLEPSQMTYQREQGVLLARLARTGVGSRERV